MTLKIDRTAWKEFTVLTLSGRIEAEHIKELKELIKLQTDGGHVIVDLREVRLADREAVRFLARCETAGVELKNCPAYIREWIRKEDCSETDINSPQ